MIFNNDNNNNGLLFIHTLLIFPILKGASRVIFTNFLNARPWHDLIYTLLGAKSLLSVIVG